MTTLNQDKKVYEIFVITPEGISDINKNVWSYIRELFKPVGVVASVLAFSKNYNIPKNKNLFWVKIFLTEDQLNNLKNLEDVLYIFHQGKTLKEPPK